MPIDYTLLGKRIASFRSKTNISQEKLGELVHVNNTHISNIETGRSRPSADILVDIANALNVTPNDLLKDSMIQHIEQKSRFELILLDCTKVEEEILIRNAENLKAILYGLGI